MKGRNGSFSIIHMGVSKNNGTPKSSILIGFSIIYHPFWGTIIFGNTRIIHIATSLSHGGGPLPETNSLPLKMVGFQVRNLQNSRGPLFSGAMYLLVSGRVIKDIIIPLSKFDLQQKVESAEFIEKTMDVLVIYRSERCAEKTCEKNMESCWKYIGACKHH